MQRVSSASVTVAGEEVGAVDGPGILLLVGVTHDDGPEQAAWLARKVAGLRVMRDEASVADLAATVLVVSQFTLYGDARKGRRPTWQDAAPAAVAEPLYEAVCAELAGLGVRVERGVFGADMEVALVNDGPVTIWLETTRTT